jgi:cysteine synthase
VDLQQGGFTLLPHFLVAVTIMNKNTVVEGIGINRLTKNIELALSDQRCFPVRFPDFHSRKSGDNIRSWRRVTSTISITDAEAVSMARFLVQRDSLFLGSSSAVNLPVARDLLWERNRWVMMNLSASPRRKFSRVHGVPFLTTLRQARGFFLHH